MYLFHLFWTVLSNRPDLFSLFIFRPPFPPVSVSHLFDTKRTQTTRVYSNTAAVHQRRSTFMRVINHTAALRVLLRLGPALPAHIGTTHESAICSIVEVCMDCHWTLAWAYPALSAASRVLDTVCYRMSRQVYAYTWSGCVVLYLTFFDTHQENENNAWVLVRDSSTPRKSNSCALAVTATLRVLLRLGPALHTLQQYGYVHILGMHKHCARRSVTGFAIRRHQNHDDVENAALQIYECRIQYKGVQLGQQHFSNTYWYFIQRKNTRTKD